MSVIALLSAWFFYSWVTWAFPFSVVFSAMLTSPEQHALLQYTRNSRQFHDYVAIFGDSYAWGQGDGMVALQKQRRPEYNATHFMYKKSGVDVVSFGYPSTGSIQAYIMQPAKQFSYIRKSRFNSIEKPSEIVLYFYEGNDIEENIVEDRGALIEHGYDDKEIEKFSEDQDFFEKVIGEYPIESDSYGLYFLEDMSRMFVFLNHAVRFVLGESSNRFQTIANQPAAEGKINRIVLNQKVVGIPDGLQGPSMLLDQKETDEGFRVLARTIHYVRKQYPDIPIVLLHIPSAATIYHFASDTVDLWNMSKPFIDINSAESGKIRVRSNDFCRRAMAIANAEGVSFYDARPVLAKAGERKILHGPVDWHHFNLLGYQVLADEVLSAMSGVKLNGGGVIKSCVDLG